MFIVMICVMYFFFDKKVGFILNKNILWVFFIDRMV